LHLIDTNGLGDCCLITF